LKQKRYKFFYKEILDKKSINELNKIEINKELLLNEEIAIFNNAKEIYFCIYNSTYSNLIIYDNKGNKINGIILFLSKDSYLMKFNNNILIIYGHYKITIIYFYKNYKSHKILTLSLIYVQPGINTLNFFNLDNFLLPDFLNNEEKLIKTSSNNFFFVTLEKLFQ